ncbi:uncharacterized protein TA05095 [Theileria annulata]|uniref:Uncharacterized protein n=1 Tax=Theileria annulata TaxID=5874 RepID=Q4UBP6_THEAN|nr:uncharacterized protein TA05095 [Theileria annulata]CAI75755.1 hypothetical protein TA05095 [Theileria annulata]|eukprot:XP_955231.1 hypothetical protein TA05095 [Theileria annulata]
MKSSANNFIKMALPVNLDENIVCIATSRYFSCCSNLYVFTNPTNSLLKGDAFSWGLAKDHRLGIGETKSKIVYKPTPIANTNMIGDLMDKFELDSYKHTSMSGYEKILNYFLDELHYSSDPHSINWRNLQIILQNEEKITSESSIKIFEEDLVKCLKTHVDFILNMNESYGRVRALQFKLMSMVRSFCSSLKGQKELTNLKPIKESFGPFKTKLTQIEKLIEILFLQPAYFVRLSMFSKDLDLVSNIIHHVYGDIQVPRIHNQYFALLRSLLREETSLFFKPSNPLNALFSPFSRILRTYAMNKYFLVENAHLFLSKTDQQSVVSHLLTYSSPILIPEEGFGISTNPKEHKKYKEGMSKFGSFIVYLATVLSKLNLHNNIKVLFTQMHNLVREKIPVEWASPSVPLEYLAIFPLIPVFVFAIIQPFFTDPKLISQMCGIGEIDDEALLKNMTVISRYFDYIVNPELKMPPMPSALTSLAQTMYSNLSRLFLEYLRSILHIEDNFYTEMTMQIFKSHFDLDYINLNIPSDTVAKLVNLCHSSSHYLNLSAHDPLIKVISNISGSKNLSSNDHIYPTDFIEKLSRSNLSINIKVDHRFMAHDRNMSFCTFSNTFVPQKLAYRQSTYSEDCVKFISLIVRYLPFGKYDPCKIFQDALVELDDLRIQYGTYEDLADEMFVKSKYFSSLRSPDFKRAGIAKEIFETVQKLRSNDITPTLLAKTILKKSLDRIRHRKYLLNIYQRQNEIEQCRRNFESYVSYNIQYLNSCINSLLYGHIDPSIKRAAIKYNVNLFSLNSKKTIEGKKIVDDKRGVASFKEHSCLELYRNGTLVPDESVTTRMFNRLVMIFSASIDSGCYITLSGIDPSSEQQEHEFLSFDLLQKFVDSSNCGYHQIFTNPSYPFGMFVIKVSFLVDTFMTLVKNY